MTINRRTLLTAPALIAAVTIPAALAHARPAEPVTLELLNAYNYWLFYEHRQLAMTMFPHAGDKAPRIIPMDHNACGWHWRDYGEPERPAPSTRAALVLDAVGVDWRARA